MSDRKTPMLSLAASHSGTWTVCKGQPGLVLDLQRKGDIPLENKTVYNVEGVKAHAVSEAILRRLPVPAYATDEMKKHGENYADYCRSLVANGGQFFTEQRVKLWYMEGRKGLVDFAAITPRNVHIVDLKYGMGVKVYPQENRQMMIYARGFIELLIDSGMYDFPDDFPVGFTIFQPRIKGEDEPWFTTWGELKRLTDEYITKPAKEILADPHNPALPFSPGHKTCQFCPAENHCMARTKWLIGDVECFQVLIDEKQPEVLQLPEPKALSAAQFGFLCANRKALFKWLESVEKMGMALAKDGKTPEGCKVIDGRNCRTWKDKDRAGELLLQKLPRGKVYPEDMITTAQACEVVDELPDVSTKWLNLFNTTWGWAKGHPQLVPLSHKGTAIDYTPESEFEDLTAVTGFAPEVIAEISDADVLD